MKNIIIITIFFLFQNLNVFAQENSEISQNWSEVKNQFELKAELVLKFANKVQKSKSIDQSELKKTVIYANELKKILENKTLSQRTVTETRQNINTLNTHLVRILVGLESDFKLKKEESVIFLSDQLSTIENQSFAEIKKYNQTCIKQNRKELIFEISDENRPPSVEF